MHDGKKRFNKYFSYKELKELAGSNGIDFSVRRFVLTVCVFLLSLYCMGLLYRLHLPELLALFVIGMVLVLPYIKYYYRQRGERKKFQDVDIYLHQMAYSFQRSPKINIALQDTEKVLEGPMRSVVNKAIRKLEYSNTDQVYLEALELIEQAYPCPRISTLHRFLISIEERGGSYYHSLDVLLEDYDRWIRRVHKEQQDIWQIKNNATFGVILSSCLATASLIISSILKQSAQFEIDIVEDWLYQIVSTIFLLCNMLYLVGIQVQCNKDWLDSARTKERIVKDYNLVFGAESRSIRNFTRVAAAIGVLLAAICVCVRGYIAAIGVAVFTLYFAMVPKFNKKSAFLRLKDDIYMAFSEWLRDVVINLQSAPLQAAVMDTYDNCPLAMKESLGRFIYEMNENPSDVRPFYNFMCEFGISDVSSTVKMLYSVSEMEADNSDRVLNTLIRRNYEILEKHEEIKSKNNLSVLRFCEYIPMIFVSFKLGADMMIIIANYL